MTNNSEQLQVVVTSLEQVDPLINQSVKEMSDNMPEATIIRLFNQTSLDLFTIINIITDRIGKTEEYKLAGYKALFDNAIKINAKLPIDKFTLIILEFAPQIYSQDENCFLNMSIPDRRISVGNSFGFIRSEMFKNLWMVLNTSDREQVSEKVISLTTYAHAYLYKTVTKNNVSK